MSDDWKFTAEDFDSRNGIQAYIGKPSAHAIYTKEAAAMANAKLAEWLAAAPVVSFNDEHSMSEARAFVCTQGVQQPSDTHTARLIQITPIVRESEERALLREMIADHEELMRVDLARKEWPLITRARKLLAKPWREGEE